MTTQAEPIAFFDVDETLIAIKSMFDFLHFLDRSIAAIDAAMVRREMQRLHAAGKSRSDINIAFWQNFAGLSQVAVRKAAEAWADEKLSDQKALFILPSLSRLVQHKRDGHGIAFVSGSAVDILAPLAKRLEVDHVLATRLEVVDGCFTGAVIPPVMIGEGKRAAAQSLMADLPVDPARCFAYGDHITDLPMLELVGHPCAVGRSGALAELAASRGWPVLSGMESMEVL